MKKILFISHEAYRTGAPLVLLALLKELKKRYPKAILHVLQLKGGPIEQDFRDVANVYACTFDNKDGLKRLVPFRLRRHLNNRLYRRWLIKPHYDLIYANTIASIEKAVELKKMLHIPILAHIHEMEYTFRQYKIKKEIIQQCDSFIAVSSTVASTLESYGTKKEKIKLIPPFSSNLELATRINAPCGISGVEIKDFVIGLSGQGGWRKGTDLLPLLVKIFVSKYPHVSCKFVWVGYTDEDAVNYEAQRLGISDCIIQTGVVSNPMEYYKRFDIFLLLSREDPFPLVCMECAALSKPIVLFENASGIVDLVKNGESGFVVPYLNLDKMTDAIFRLYEDECLRRFMGENINKALLCNYSMDTSINRIIETIE